jgi:hypothetical protein
MPNLGILTCYTPNLSDIGNITSKNKQDYCKKWDYTFLLEIQEYNNQLKNIYFTKIEYTLRMMNLYPNIDWFIWIDHDALIMNFNIPLTNFIDENLDFIVGEDWNGLNSGVFFIRNCDASKHFLEAVLQFQSTELDRLLKPSWWTEKEQMPMFELRHLLRSKIVHHSLFNSYLITPRPDNDWRWHNMGPSNLPYITVVYQPGDFILHFLGDFEDNKMKNINKYLTEIQK